MNQRIEKLKHLYGWDTFHTTVTLPEHNSYKYPDGIVLTLKTANNADHYFVERTHAVQLANSIKESLLSKLVKRKQATSAKPSELKPVENKSKQSKKKQ